MAICAKNVALGDLFPNFGAPLTPSNPFPYAKQFVGWFSVVEMEDWVPFFVTTGTSMFRFELDDFCSKFGSFSFLSLTFLTTILICSYSYSFHAANIAKFVSIRDI